MSSWYQRAGSPACALLSGAWPWAEPALSDLDTIADYIAKNGTDSLRDGLGRKIEMPEGVQITGKAGDAVICHYQLAHDKEQNLSHQIRYAAYWRLWHKDAERCQPEGLTDIWREWPAISALIKKKNGPKSKNRN